MLSVVIFVLASNSNELCENDPNYFYWPTVVDSTEYHLKSVNDYYKKIDIITKRIEKTVQARQPDWRVYYRIYLKYAYMEKISKNVHPKREIYYKEMKEIYLSVAEELRKIRSKKRILQSIYHFE